MKVAIFVLFCFFASLLSASAGENSNIHPLDANSVGIVVPTSGDVYSLTNQPGGTLVYDMVEDRLEIQNPFGGWQPLNVGFGRYPATSNAPASNTPNQDVEQAQITQTGSSTCSIVSQSGAWLTGVSCSSSGNVSLSLSSTVYDSAPNCTITPVGPDVSGNAQLAYVVSSSTTAISYFLGQTGGVGEIGTVNIICLGNSAN